MVDAGQVRPLIGAEYGLNDTAKAQEASETGRATGKIVIYVGHP
jgi:NADPH:quinone reductase-like Zn-dependent oxidoreductase